MPQVWRRSIIEALDVINLLDARIIPLDHELRPLARADARIVLLDTVPGVGDLLGLTRVRDWLCLRVSLPAQADRLSSMSCRPHRHRQPLLTAGQTPRQRRATEPRAAAQDATFAGELSASSIGVWSPGKCMGHSHESVHGAG